MGALFGLIPLPWKIGGMVFLALAAFGAYEGWAYHERSLGAAGVTAADKKELDAQQGKDDILSTKEVEATRAKTNALDAVAKPAEDKIKADTPDQADADAAKAVACMLDKSKC